MDTLRGSAGIMPPANVVDVVCSDGRIAAVRPAKDGPADARSRLGRPGPVRSANQRLRRHQLQFRPRLTVDAVRHVVRDVPAARHRRLAARRSSPTPAKRCCTASPTLAPGLRRRMPDLAARSRRFIWKGRTSVAEDGPRGAHPRQHVRPPDWDEFRRLQDAAGGRIRLVTLAPEHEGALPFIEKLTSVGRRRRSRPYGGDRGAASATPSPPGPASARTWATARTPCCPGTTTTSGSSSPRTSCGPASSATAIICRRLWCRCFLRVKTPARTILTCDASSLAGLPPGRYREWDQEFEVLPSRQVRRARTRVTWPAPACSPTPASARSSSRPG